MSQILKDRYPADVVAYCEQHDLTEKLDLVVDILAQAFPDAQRIVVGMEDDPESTERWILVEAVVDGPAREIRLRHKECVRRMTDILPWPLWMLIRTTYTPA
jgi:hypothetical protein